MKKDDRFYKLLDDIVETVLNNCYTHTERWRTERGEERMDIDIEPESCCEPKVEALLEKYLEGEE